MNTFKKLALVAAISAAPFAQAELVSMDDAVLSDMTGQAGISIELSAAVAIGSVEYTDTDLGGGTVGINGIKLGGAGTGAVAGNLDGIKVDIDVDDTDGLIINVGQSGTDAIDFGLSVDSVAMNGGTSFLASGIYLGGEIGDTVVTINNDSDINVQSSFKITDGSLTVDTLGLGITNLVIDDDGAMATLAMDITPVTTSGTTVVTDALNIAIADMNLDIAMDATLGSVAGVASSLGSIKINDLSLTNTTLVIYGH